MKRLIKSMVVTAVALSLTSFAIPSFVSAEYDLDTQIDTQKMVGAVLSGLGKQTSDSQQGGLFSKFYESPTIVTIDGDLAIGSNSVRVPKELFFQKLMDSINSGVNYYVERGLHEKCLSYDDLQAGQFDNRALDWAKGTFYEKYVYARLVEKAAHGACPAKQAIIDAHYPNGYDGADWIEGYIPADYVREYETARPTPTPEPVSDKFKDLPLSHWAKDTVEKIADLGYFSGYEDGTFKPDNQMTHEEFLKVIVEIAGLDVTPVAADYVQNDNHIDTKWASWAQPYLNAAFDAGLIAKHTDDRDLFQVNKPITRAEMAKLIGRLNEYLKKTNTAENTDLSNVITDWNTIPEEYKDYVAKAYTAGIINGYEDGTFRPNGNLTRAEASTVILKVIEQ